MSEDFVINDKRLFTKDGQVNQPTAEEAGPAASESRQTAFSDPGEGIWPAADFAGLVIGLATSALMHLGESPEPDVEAVLDLPAAKQTIDLLAVLQTKTRGNLEAEEASLLTALLYDLRMKYVRAKK